MVPGSSGGPLYSAAQSINLSRPSRVQYKSLPGHSVQAGHDQTHKSLTTKHGVPAMIAGSGFGPEGRGFRAPKQKNTP